MSKVRINKSNRDRIESYIYNKLNQIVKDQNNTRIGLPTIWDIQFEVEAKFNISDPASQKITWKVIYDNIGNV